MMTMLLLNVLLIAVFILSLAAVAVVYLGLTAVERSPWLRHEVIAVIREVLGR